MAFVVENIRLRELAIIAEQNRAGRPSVRKPDRAKWLFLGWIFRDAPSQRLGPMVTSMEGRDYNRTPSDDLKYSPYARSEGISTARAVGLECNLRGLH